MYHYEIYLYSIVIIENEITLVPRFPYMISYTVSEFFSFCNISHTWFPRRKYKTKQQQNIKFTANL